MWALTSGRSPVLGQNTKSKGDLLRVEGLEVGFRLLRGEVLAVRGTSLRVAPAVPVEQFLQETESLRSKLDRRLSDDGQADDD